jgi:hypothetical protein
MAKETVGQLLERMLPGMPLAEAEEIAWEETGYPCFWDIRPVGRIYETGRTPAECFENQLRDVAVFLPWPS